MPQDAMTTPLSSLLLLLPLHRQCAEQRLCNATGYTDAL